MISDKELEEMFGDLSEGELPKKARKELKRARKQVRLDNRIRAIVREELDIAHEAALREED